ncbi:MAG: hypothetical protein ACTHWH_05940 [Marinobacter sp.]
MNTGDYNVWTDVLVMGIPLAGMCFALLACKVSAWLSDKREEVGRG